jgi:DNA repair exonuclease SbcCD ATPase subunit
LPDDVTGDRFQGLFHVTELDPVWQRNISKKIVQMTRVVFRLHANSIDDWDEVIQLKSRCESELSQIESESRDNLARAQLEVNNCHPVIERAVRSEFEPKFNQTEIQFDAAHEKLEADSNRAIETATARLGDLKGRVEALKQKSAESMQVFTWANDEIKRIHTDTLQCISEQHQPEVARHVDEANAKYRSVVAAVCKQEDTLKRGFEAELEELRRTLASSQVSAVETLNKRQADLMAAVNNMASQKVELIEMMENFRQQSAQQQRKAEETIAQAKVLQQKMIARHEKELADLQASIAEDQKRFAEETERLKREIAREDADHEIELKQSKEKLAKEKNRLKEQLEQFEAESRQSATLADQQIHTLAEEHNATLAALDSQHATFLEDARQKEPQSHEEMAELEKKHQIELGEIRSQMEKELNASVERIEEMKKRHHEAIEQIRT